mmetsp:Transcript_15005/g.21236  ORF Transcript_15005/g.21236 Transcript_15005/m.21236 type:complete len:84 (-) Transcript_15005:655-906(-)
MKSRFDCDLPGESYVTSNFHRFTFLTIVSSRMPEFWFNVISYSFKRNELTNEKLSPSLSSLTCSFGLTSSHPPPPSSLLDCHE